MFMHKLASLSFLVAALSLIACDPEVLEIESSLQPIINGESCSAEELPETVALLVDGSVGFGGNSFPIRTLLCTGTLIAPDVVLTAAHCLDPSSLTGGFGETEDLTYYISFQTDLSAFTQQGTTPPLPADAIAVRGVVKHESFDLNSDEPEGLANFHDIGLMFLEEPVTRIEPAIVMTPEEAENLAVGDEVRIAGWGQQAPEQGAAGATKHCATTNIFEIGDYEMQIGNEPSTARKCHGDSGGPTYIDINTDTKRKGRVIGATSRAYDASDCQRGGVDTMASAWYGWIDAHMSSRCDDGSRSWCQVPGVITPEFYDSNTTDPNDVDPDGEETDQDDLNPNDDGGCSTGSGNAGGLGLAMLFLAFFSIRRREY